MNALPVTPVAFLALVAALLNLYVVGGDSFRFVERRRRRWTTWIAALMIVGNLPATFTAAVDGNELAAAFDYFTLTAWVLVGLIGIVPGELVPRSSLPSSRRRRLGNGPSSSTGGALRSTRRNPHRSQTRL